MTTVENVCFLHLLFADKPKNSYCDKKKCFLDSRVQDNADSATLDALSVTRFRWKIVFASTNAKSKLLSPTTSTTLNLLGSFTQQCQRSHMNSLHMFIKEITYFSSGILVLLYFRERLQCELAPQGHQKMLV